MILFYQVCFGYSDYGWEYVCTLGPQWRALVVLWTKPRTSPWTRCPNHLIQNDEHFRYSAKNEHFQWWLHSFLSSRSLRTFNSTLQKLQIIDLIKVVRSQTSDMILPCVGDVHIELTGSLMQIFGRVQKFIDIQQERSCEQGQKIWRYSKRYLVAMWR